MRIVGRTFEAVAAVQAARIGAAQASARKRDEYPATAGADVVDGGRHEAATVAKCDDHSGGWLQYCIHFA